MGVPENNGLLTKMRLAKAILILALLLGAPVFGEAARAADAAAPAGRVVETQAGAAAHEEHGVPPKATEIGRIGQFPITNSMVVTWIVAIGLIIFAQIATRNMKEVPEGAQNFWEWLVEGLYSFLADIIGAELGKKTFWFFATIFIFILFTNWFGLIP